VEDLFRTAFVVATVVEVVVVVILCVQVARSRRAETEREDTEREDTVITLTDTAAGVLLFVGAASVVGVALHGWSSLETADLLVYGSAFGIVAAAAVQWGRARGWAAAPWVLALPLAMGVVAGVAAV